MTRIDFYVLDNPGPRGHDVTICRVIEKAWRSGHAVHVSCVDETHAQSIDELLWTFRDISFVPHTRDLTETSVPVMIASGEQIPPRCDVLINLSGNVLNYFSQFARVVETTGADEVARQAARERYRFYQDRGYDIHTHKADHGRR